MTVEDDKARAKRQRAEWEKLLAARAASCMEELPGSIEGAGRLMASEVRKDPRLAQAVLELVLDQYCHEFIRRQVHLNNSAIWHGMDAAQLAAAKITAGGDPTQNGARLREASRSRAQRKLMEYQLMGGLHLRDAKFDDLVKNRKFQFRQAKRMNQTARWLFLLEAEIPEHDRKNKTIAQLFTEDELLHFQSLAIRDIDALDLQAG